MKMTFATLSLAMASAALLTVAGCGGGSTAPTVTPVTPSAITISGIAASGAAFVDAVVTVIDSTGAVVGTSGTVGTDGAYSVTVAAGAKAPFVLVASRTTADGEVQSLVSVIDSASTTTANVTPITNLIASLLSPSGDPGKLAEELAAGTASITPDSVAATVTEVKTILATLLDATGTTGTDPLTGSFTVDGTGYDRLLDSISINIVPASETSSNIEIAVKQALPDGEQPASISFSSSANDVAPLPAVDPNTLVEEGTAVKIASFLADLTRCYAVPFAERVNGVTPGALAVTGDAADVMAPACRNVFWGSDPVTFRNNGALVGRDANNNGAFASLFRAGATGLVFSQGSYEFTRANGDLVIGYKSRSTTGAETFDTFVVKIDTADGKLKLIGNQYQFPGGVSAYQQRRNFISLDQSAYSYYSTGYVVNVPNVVQGGMSLFNRVVVTTPRNSVLVLRPNAGSSSLTLRKGDDPASATPAGIATGTSFVRLRSEYLDGDTARTHPREVDISLFFALQDWLENDLTSTPSQGTWKYEYYLASSPDVLAGTQYYKNRARALSIGELRTQGLASLTPTLLAEIQSGTVPAGQQHAGQIVFEDGETADIRTDGGGDGWSVEPGQLPPTSVTVFGNGATTTGRGSFTDNASFPSTARQVDLACTAQTSDDLHCLNGGPAYAAGSRLDGLNLTARNASGREYVNFYAMYQLNLAP